MKHPPSLLLFLFLFATLSCHTPNHSSIIQKTYKEGLVESKKVKLQYLDWGGEGHPLVLLTGAGDTPFLFEQLAAQLSPKIRIIAYSRRGHGKSWSKEEKYDNETLVEDLKLLLDSLKIDRASLLGWSMGGNEISEFALRYPQRVIKLIYLEAGYDLSDGGFGKLQANIPTSFLPDSSIMSSLENYRAWYHRFWFGDVEWNHSLENNLRASVHVNQDGSIQTIPNNDVFRSILKEAMSYQRIYENIQAPSLVIYTKPFFHLADSNAATIALYDGLEKNIVTPWREVNRKRIAQELPNVKIIDAPAGTHTSFLFLSHDFLAESIGSFLGTGTP
jgi:pimeloyl-ACP methyl ester carboxylesterase